MPVTAARESRGWAAAGVAALAVVFVVDRLTTADVALATLLAVGPLIAAAGAGAVVTLAVSVPAVLLAVVALAVDGAFAARTASGC